MVKGKLVTLKPLEKKDLPLTLEWLNTADVGFQLGKAFPFNLAATEQWYDEFVSTHRAIVLKIMAGKFHIGNVTLDEVAPIERTARFSVYIGDRQHSRPGHALDASVSMLRYGFDQLNLYKIYSRVFSNNLAALILNEEIGFKREGVLRSEKFINGGYVDVIHLGIFRDEIVEPGP